MNRVLRRFVGAYGTIELIGRSEEQAAIRAAVSPAAHATFQVVALVADGGVGKTRLLREACWQLGVLADDDRSFNEPRVNRKHQWQREGVVCLTLLDVADPIFHSRVAFLREIRNRLGQALDQEHNPFQAFDVAFESYAEAREGAKSYNEVQDLSNAVVQRFEDDYAAITAHYRVVWVLDTLEQLFGVPRAIEQLLRDVNIKEEDIGQTTYNWLMNFIFSRPANTTLLLAGRPHPSHWIDDIANRCANLDGFGLFRLQTFTVAETKAYITQLSSELQEQNQYYETASYLQEVRDDPEFVQIIHKLANGNPIRLGLYLDLMANIAEEPAIFSMSFAELDQLPREEFNMKRRELDAMLLEYLERGVAYPETSVLPYLFVTHRGLNWARLQTLWGAPREECEQIISHMRELSFVKYRHNKLFLHDQLYEMYGEQLIHRSVSEDDPLMRQVRTTHKKLITFLEKLIEIKTEEIYDIQVQYPGRVITNEQDRETVRKARQSRRRYKAEMLHYRLYIDPQDAFNDVYFKLAEQAFLGRDPDLDSYLQSEIDLFFFGATAKLNRELTGLSDEAWLQLQHEVNEERVLRWLKRIIQFGRYRRANEFAKQLVPRYGELVFESQPDQHTLSVPTLFRTQAEAYRNFALINLGKTIGDALRELEQLILTMKGELRQLLPNEAVRPRMLNTLAHFLSQAGYGNAMLGRYPAAKNHYHEALSILLHTEHEALLAEVKNNLARVIGEMGHYRQARRYCTEGLNTRLRLGFDYAVGLSLNTRALIETRNDRPTPAIKDAENALRLFRQLADARGIVLAATQLAQAKRRSWRLRQEASDTLLQEADEQMVEVEYLCEHVVDERVRRVEAYIELGCLYRDWVMLAKQHTPQSQDLDTLRRRAVTYLDRALEEASDAEDQVSITHFTLTAILDKAYLYSYLGQFEEARATVDTVLEMTPPEYKLSKDQALDLSTIPNRVIFNQLSKLYALLKQLTPLNKDNFELVLEYHILAITYSQLFSSFDHWYLGENGDHLRALLHDYEFFGSKEEQSMVNKIIEQYHLQDLIGQPGFEAEELEVDKVRREFTEQQDADYLRPPIII